MRYRVTYNGEVVGTSDLAGCDPTMGVVEGDFVPTPAYERVREVFRMYATASTNLVDIDQSRFESYYAARDALNLGLETDEGVPILVQTIHVDDFSVEIGEYRLTVWTYDISVFESCRETVRR